MEAAMRMNRRTLRAAALFVAFALPLSLRADDLDALLAQPPSASLTADDAAHRIEMMRELIASHPDRADEIEAYLIPFVRVTQPPPAAPTPAPTPPPAEAKPLLVLREPDGSASTMRATSYRRQGAVVMVVGANGSHAVLQAPTVVGELPWYSGKDIESGAVDLKDLAERYEAFIKAVPGLRPTLAPEVGQLRKLQKARDDAAAAKQNSAQARLAEATAAVYNQSAGYTPAALAKLLLAAEKSRKEMPESADAIDAWAAPFREHFTKLISGQSLVNGKWASNEELARQAREKRQAEFLSGLDYQIGTEPFPEGSARGLLVPLLAATGLALAAGVGLLVYGRRRIPLLAAGAAVLAATPLVLAGVFFFATRDPALLPSSIPMADEQPIVDVLSQAAGLDDGAGSQKISEQALNGFLSRHVRLAPSAGNGTGDTRQAVAIRLLPGRVAVFEMIRSMGLDWIVRIDLEYRQSEGRPMLTLLGAKIGGLDCSRDFAAALWKNLESQFAAILSSSRLTAQFAIQNPGNGSVELKPLAKAATSAP